VLIGLMLIYAVSNGILVFGLPLFYPSLIEEFGWTTVQVTLPATAFFVFGAITSPPAGVLLDRYSPKLIILIGVIGLTIGLAWFSTVTALWQLVCVYLILGLSLSLCGLVSNMVVLAGWFSKKRGLAIGLLLLAASLGSMVFAFIIGAGTESYGWRPTMMTLCVITAVVTFFSLGFLITDPPRRDESATQRIDRSKELRNPDQWQDFFKAVKTPPFYLIALATACIWFAIIALIQHQVIYLGKDIGVDRALLSPVLSLFFACAIVGKLAFGWLSDYFDKRYTLILSVLLFIAGLWVFRSLETQQTTLLYAYAVFAGIGFSGAFTSIQVLIAHYFSGPSYGKILAILVLLDSLAGALGTRVIASMRDYAGDYFLSINIMIMACVIAVICLFVIIKTDPAKPLPNNS